MKKRRASAVVWLLVCAAAPLLVSTVAEHDFLVRNLRWVGMPGSARDVVIVNPFGDIRLRPSESHEIVASATIQELTPDQPEIDLAVNETGGRSLVEVRLPDDAGRFGGRVDLTVLLPKDVSVTANAVDGNIHIKSISGPLTVRTETGDVLATFKRLTKRVGGDALLLESGSGDVETTFLVDANLRIHATAGGRVHTDIPRRMHSTLRRGTGRVEGSLGTGDTQLTIRAATGDVRLQIPERNEWMVDIEGAER